MKQILPILAIFFITGCDAVDVIKNKFISKEKYKLFLIASKQEVDINKFKVEKELYKDSVVKDF